MSNIFDPLKLKDYSLTSFGFRGKLEFNCNRVTSLLNKFQPPTWLEIYLFSLKSYERTPARHVATGVRHVSPGEIGDRKSYCNITRDCFCRYVVRSRVTLFCPASNHNTGFISRGSVQPIRNVRLMTS